MEERKRIISYIAVIITVTIWASTYISTKYLVLYFTPLQIAFVRFSIGLISLFVLSPPKKRQIKWKDEFYIILAGVLGMFLYYILENYAAKYTYASNISIIVTTIPLLTAFISPLFIKNENFQPHLVPAFLLSMIGVSILFLGKRGFEGVSIRGDLLALGASIVFSLYTIVLKSISSGISSLEITRKSLTSGWILMLITLIIRNNLPRLDDVIKLDFLFHFLFLGLFASGLCFFLWGVGVRGLGSVKASQFIYLMPFVTIILSFIVLGEKMSVEKSIGLVLILLGVIWAEKGRMLIRRFKNWQTMR